MRQQQVQNLVLAGLLLLIGAGLGAAYWFGGDRATAGATGPVVPIKKFRADPGTERENARALVSSVPSLPEETTDRPIEIWGSLDEDDAEPAWEQFDAVRAEVDELPAEEARELLESKLESSEISADERAQLDAALALALLDAEEPDPAAAREAFARAFRNCSDADARVRLAEVYGVLLYEREHYEEALELVDEGRFVGAQFSPARLMLEAVRGLALDALGRDAAARKTYERAFESALASDLGTYPRGRDAARLIALRLARQYRQEGRPEDAVAVSRMLRAWLEEDDLALR